MPRNWQFLQVPRTVSLAAFLPCAPKELAPLKTTEQRKIKGVSQRGKCGDGKTRLPGTSAHVPDAPKQSMHYVEIADTVRVAVRMSEDRR
jgi:hypothetical protein